MKIFLLRQTMRKKKPTETKSTAFLLPYFFLALLVLSTNGEAEEEAVGYGYTVRSIAADPSGKWLTANLQLIKSSSVYGPDIQSLVLLARCTSIFFSFSLSSINQEYARIHHSYNQNYHHQSNKYEIRKKK